VPRHTDNIVQIRLRYH